MGSGRGTDESGLSSLLREVARLPDAPQVRQDAANRGAVGVGAERSARATLGAVAVLMAAIWVAPSGCASHEAPDAGPAVVQDLSPVPAPEGLVGDLFLPSPETTWTRVRAIAGGSAAILPQSFGGIAATLLKLAVPTQPGEGAIGRA